MHTQKEEMWDVLQNISSTGISKDSMGNTVIPGSKQDGSEEIIAADSSARWFQQFMRRHKFKPVVLLAWIAWREEWPSRPWVQESSKILPDLDKFEFLPAIIEPNGLEFWEARYRVPINYHADLLMLPLIYGVRSLDENLNPKKPEATPQFVFDLLCQCGAFSHINFYLNWQNYSRKELAVELDKWLQEHWPLGLKPLQAGGRVEPMAWLQGLGAYRLYVAAKADAGILRKWKKEFCIKSRQTDHSIALHASRFFDSVLAQFIPKE